MKCYVLCTGIVWVVYGEEWAGQQAIPGSTRDTRGAPGQSVSVSWTPESCPVALFIHALHCPWSSLPSNLGSKSVCSRPHLLQCDISVACSGKDKWPEACGTWSNGHCLPHLPVRLATTDSLCGWNSSGSSCWSPELTWPNITPPHVSQVPLLRVLMLVWCTTHFLKWPVSGSPRTLPLSPPNLSMSLRTPLLCSSTIVGWWDHPVIVSPLSLLLSTSIGHSHTGLCDWCVGNGSWCSSPSPC